MKWNIGLENTLGARLLRSSKRTPQNLSMKAKLEKDKTKKTRQTIILVGFLLVTGFAMMFIVNLSLIELPNIIALLG